MGQSRAETCMEEDVKRRRRCEQEEQCELDEE
jgi:hypothetical protein